MRQIDPDRLISRIFAERPARVVALLLILYGVLSLFHLYTAGRSGVVTADPYTYLTFARSLAEGSMQFPGVLGEAMQTFAENEGVVSGPIWNVNLLPDGTPVYTVAVGYPLFLAAMFRLGGYWLYTHINLLLLGLVLVLFLLCVREGLKGSLFAWCVGGMACILLMRSHPYSWLRFSYPWREPLYLVCLLGSFHALQRFGKGGRLRWVALAGLLLGYSVAVKEVNAIYGPIFGLFLLCTPGFRGHSRKLAVLALFVVTGLIGTAPILIQNLLTTGHPLLSLQMVRETQPYADVGHSSITPLLVARNIRLYAQLYRTFPMFAIPFVGVAVVGLCASLRTGLGRTMAGLLVVHLFLYLQWGGYDVRHMYPAHLPYALFLAWGFAWLARQIADRVPGLGRFRNGVLLVPLFLVAVWPSHRPVPHGAADFDYRAARTLVGEIEARTGPDAVILSNRVLRDVIGSFSSMEVVRLHDLANFHPDHDIEVLLQWLGQKGVPVYFLDNTDLDPRNRDVIDWSNTDEQWLLDRHNLDPALVLTSEDYSLHAVTRRESLRGYRVRPWHHRELVRALDVPEEGAAFLYLHLRGLEGDPEIRVEDLPHDRPETFFLPVHQKPVQDELHFELRADGRLLPALEDLRVIGWHETIRQDLGAEVSLYDDWVFPDGLPEQQYADFRYVDAPFRMRVPVRQTEESFTAVMLMGGLPRATNVNLYASWEGQPRALFGFAGNHAWLPMRLPVSGTWAGIAELHVDSDAPAMAKLHRLTAVPTHRVLRHRPAPDILGVGLAGFLMAEQMNMKAQNWSASVNGRALAEGRCFVDPRRSSNRFRRIVAHAPADAPIEVRFQGAGLLQEQWVEVGERLTLSPEAPEALFVESGIRPPEGQGRDAFWWTQEETTIWVPVSPARRHYELALEVADVRPGPDDTLDIELNGARTTLPAPKTRETIRHTFTVETNEGGLIPLRLYGPTWIPRDTLPESRDERTLGLQFYGLTWAPAGDTSPMP